MVQLQPDSDFTRSRGGEALGSTLGGLQLNHMGARPVVSTSHVVSVLPERFRDRSGYGRP